MNKEIINIKNKTYKRINKTAAITAYNDNKTIFLLPSNVTFNNQWIKPYAINKRSELTFKRQLNNYSYYNTNKDLGNYIKYYIEIETKKTLTEKIK